MDCYRCGPKTQLIWGGDHDYEDGLCYSGCEDGMEEGIVTNLSCPKCSAFVLVYMPND